MRVAVDCAVFGYDEEALQVLLIERAREPFAGRWALPGGFVEEDEGLAEAARRELAEETGIQADSLEQIGAFGEPGRDPRARVISVGYFALVRRCELAPRAASDARTAAWFPADRLPPLAFDHAEIVGAALGVARERVGRSALGFTLLPRKFTLTQLQRLYEVVLGRSLDKRNFRRRVLEMDLLVALDEVQSGASHRAARLYRFDGRRYREMVKRGFVFEV